MISVVEALQQILAHAQAGPVVKVPALEAVDSVLAEEVFSDIDSPPYDKAMMDGYAIHAEHLGGQPVELEVIEEVMAGEVPTRPLVPGEATHIMTGAPVPEGAGAVVMVEQTEMVNEGAVGVAKVRILNTGLSSGANILPKATSLAKGQSVLQPGKLIRPIEVGVLSEIGKTQVAVYARPTVAVMTSGNELVTPEVQPAPGQIRNSNNAMLTAMARRAGARAEDVGIARDEESDIRRFVDDGLTRDMLILSGGVSAGVLDLVPKVLADAGVKQVFHKVSIKPGKPLWFGLFEKDDHRCLVFGLPGNSVSSLVCFELFVRPAIAKLRGLQNIASPRTAARLTQPHSHRGDRPVYFPAVLHATDELPSVTPLPWQGSADLSTLTKANCLIHFPSGDRQYEPGDSVTVILDSH